MSSNFYVSCGIAILLIMFNVYFVNVVTGSDRKPEYPDYPYDSCTVYDYSNGHSSSRKDQECEEKVAVKKQKYDAIKHIREKLEYKRHLGLLVMGILNLVLAMLINTPYVSTALGISGLITLIYATGTFWTKYNDKARLCIVTTGLVIVLYMTYRVFGKEMGAFNFGMK